MAATSEHPLILHEARHSARAGVAARVLATAEVVEVHVVLSAQRDGRGGVAAEAAADGVGDDPEALPGVPQYAVRTQRPRLVRVPSTYCTWGPGGKPPCASGTDPTREAGTRSLYVPNGGAGAYVSAQMRCRNLYTKQKEREPCRTFGPTRKTPGTW